MSDTPAPAPSPAPARRWWQYRRNQAGVALLLFLIWSIAANSWTDKGCSAVPQSYVLTVQHFGPPSHDEGCDEYGDYTDNYYGD